MRGAISKLKHGSWSCHVRLFHQARKVLLGQPCHDTHPEIIGADEVTPRISKQEYKTRRDKLVQSLRKFGELSKMHFLHSI